MPAGIFVAFLNSCLFCIFASAIFAFPTILLEGGLTIGIHLGEILGLKVQTERKFQCTILFKVSEETCGVPG
jgi:hypothetical protein